MKLFALLILIGSATASLRGKISQQQTLGVDDAPKDGAVELLYIRHGESKGNAGSAAWERGHVVKAIWYGAQAADGKLTGDGKQQARDGVANGGDAKRAFICDQKANTLYTVSPLRRAMATFIITYLHACAKDKKIEFPKKENIVVLPQLREKYKTSSEGVKGNPSKGYILEQAEKECMKMIAKNELESKEKSKCSDFGQVLTREWVRALSNDEDRNDAEGATPLTLKLNAGRFQKQMNSLSKTVATLVIKHKSKITHVVFVAHSGTGRIFFGCAMARGPNNGQVNFDDNAKKQNLIRGYITGLNTLGNAGSMLLKGTVTANGLAVKGPDANGEFYNMVDDGKPLPYAGSLDKTDGSDVFTRSCIAEGVIPAGSKITKFENFKYTGPDYFTKGSDGHPKDCEKEFVQAHLSNAGGRSSISFAGDYGGKPYSAIEERLNECTANAFGDGTKVKVQCGTEEERGNAETFAAKFPHFVPDGATLKFKDEDTAAEFTTLFDKYKTEPESDKDEDEEFNDLGNIDDDIASGKAVSTPDLSAKDLRDEDKYPSKRKGRHKKKHEFGQTKL